MNRGSSGAYALSAVRRTRQRGYSLLALIVALAVLAILITMKADNAAAMRQRELEIEFIHRGTAVAEAIARYNNGGVRLAPLNPGGRFPQKLEDLVKGDFISGRKVYYLRPSAAKDPLNGDQEWRPLRVGDPLLRKFLNEWAAANLQPIPTNYLTLTNAAEFIDDEDEDDEETDQAGEGAAVKNNGNQQVSGAPTLPIVGVVGTSPKQTFTRQFGKDKRYSEWVFLYMPPVQPQIIVPEIQNPGNGTQPDQPRN